MTRLRGRPTNNAARLPKPSLLPREGYRRKRAALSCPLGAEKSDPSLWNGVRTHYSLSLSLSLSLSTS
jgi:hypothetical protein